ncbi:hypothetical protein PLESTM_001728300 [Pleodorina starrii]|nr:hypothetical protein PLESTM_001728300 [Pleodorina starrii]
MLGPSGRTGPRPPPTADVNVLDRQLEQGGDVEVNASAMRRDELIEWAKKLRESAHRVKSLRILCVPRGIMWSQYHYSQLQRNSDQGQHIYASPEHKMAVKIASANVQHHVVRTAFYKAVCAVVRRAPLEELVLGLRFSDSGCTMLSNALASTTSLKRLSFAGSHMGDARITILKPGLVSNNSLEELDLTACALSDEAACSVASVIKAHVDRRMALAFDGQLRCYPNTSLPPARAHLEHHAELRAIAREVDEQAGGLLHLEMAENKLTDKGARALCTALTYDRRLIFLSLRANQLTAAAETEIIPLMKEHQALLRVDLRQNTEPQLGILKLKRRVAPRVFSAALGFRPHPAASGPLSPSRTETSMPLWALREELPDSLGPTPMATPRQQSHQNHLHHQNNQYHQHHQSQHHAQHKQNQQQQFPPNSPGHMSTVSWGDLHLLVRGAPPTPVGAGGAGKSAAGAGAGRRRRDGTDGGGGSVADGGPDSPVVRITVEQPPPQQGQQEQQQQQQQRWQTGGPTGRLWGDREATLSGESAMAPGASGVYDTPQRRTGTGNGSGAAGTESDFVLQASGPAAAEAAAAAAAVVTGVPVALSSGDSFGFEAPGGAPVAAPHPDGLGNGIAEPVGAAPWQHDLMGGGAGGGVGPGPALGSNLGALPSTPVSMRAVRQPAAAAAGHGGQSPLLGRSPLTRVSGPATGVGGGGGSAGGGGGGGGTAGSVPWVWGRPVNPDGSDMVVLTATASPTRAQKPPSADRKPPSADRKQHQQQWPQQRPLSAPSPRQRAAAAPYPAAHEGPVGRSSNGISAGIAAAAAVACSHPSSPKPGWVKVPGGGVAWRAAPVPIAGLTAPHPQPQCSPQAAYSGPSSPTRGSVPAVFGLPGGPGSAFRGQAGTGSGVGAAGLTGGGGGQWQAAAGFPSMLHREGLAAGQGSYDYLFGPTGQPQRRRATPRRQAQEGPSAAGGSPGGAAVGDGGGGSLRRPRRWVEGRGWRGALGFGTSVAPHTRASSLSSPQATPTRHFPRHGVGAATLTSAAKSRSSGRAPLGRDSASTGAAGSGPGGSARKARNTPGHSNGLAFRKGRRIRAKRTRGPGSAMNDPPGRAVSSTPRRQARRAAAASGRRRFTAADTTTYDDSPAVLEALEQSLMQMAAEVTALEAAAAAAQADAAAAAEREAEQREAAIVDAGRVAAEAAERAAAAAEAARSAAVVAVDRAAAAERRAKDAIRRAAKAAASTAGPATAAAAAAPAAAEGRQPATQPSRAVQLPQPHQEVRQYEGAARGSGVNVNTIIQQLDRWCGLCDDALLRPPSPPPSPPGRVHAPSPQCQQQQQQAQPHAPQVLRVQSPVRPPSLQAKVQSRPRVSAVPLPQQQQQLPQRGRRPLIQQQEHELQQQQQQQQKVAPAGKVQTPCVTSSSPRRR